MKSRFILFSLFLLSAIFRLAAQPKSHIEHYNLVDGLSQRTIMNIIQDKRGFIWLATWDGLCKFDGYTFTNYKTTTEDSIMMRTTRVDKICEDTYGYIWLYTYNRDVFRFDPYTEKFTATFNIGDQPFKTSQILPMSSGKVWLISETMGAICVSDSSNSFRAFTSENGQLQSNKINTAYEDSHGNSWILTNSGILQISPAMRETNSTIPHFFTNPTQKETTPFFSVVETDTEIWFGSDRGRIWCYNKQEERFKVFETGVDSDIISIKKVYDNLLVILTSKDGFIICDKNRSNPMLFNRSKLPSLPTNEMVSCFIDTSNNIWFEMNHPGVAKFNLLSNKLSYYNPVNYRGNYMFAPHFLILEDKAGHIWVHPRGLFSFYDNKTDKLLPFYNDPYSTDWKFSDALHDAFLDRQGNLWLGTRTGGLEKIVFDNEFFKLNDFYSSNMFSTGYEVRSFFEDEHRNMWVGNMNGAISIYNSKREFEGFLCEDGTISKTGKQLEALAYAIHCDKQKNIWIGTKGKGIYKLTANNDRGNSFRMKQYTHSPNDPYSLSHDAIYAIHEDTEGRLWFGTYGAGLNLFDSQNERFINQKNLFGNQPFDSEIRIRTLQGHNGKIYAGTTLGLMAFSFDPEKLVINNYKVYSKEQKTPEGLRANDIYALYVTQNNDLYIATFGGGLSKVTEWDGEGYPKAFKTYDKNSGLHSDIVLSIIEDAENRLWINSEGNLSRFNPIDESFEQFNDVSRTISNQYFTEAFPILTSEGELIYGCTHGTLSFVPNKITKDGYVPYLALTRFRVFNNDYPLDNQIDNTRQIRLNHNENMFSFEYAALDYNNPHGISYAYMLEGFDKEWVDGQKQRMANYTNIPPGEYTFKVRSTNSNGTWVDNERSLSIIIVPSFWQTNWALLLYIIVICLLLYVILRSIFLFYRMKDRVIIEQEQTELKTRFFTDISHEIRTPLTMIVTPIENIIDNENTSPDIKGQLRLVLKNTNRMLKMVNQILDFRKIQKQKLYIKEISLGNYVQEVCDSSFKTIESQGITLTVNNQIGTDKVWVDVESIEKLLFNLISNSIKSIGNGKKIEVNVFRKDKSIALQVKDQGRGMTKEVMSKLFTRFSSFNLDKSKPSTGIGLSIVKEIVDKHHARILVDSELNKGSAFTVLFHAGVEHFLNDENVDIVRSDETAETTSGLSASDIDTTNKISLPSSDTGEKENCLSILVVEDDEDLRGFIHSVLSPYYTVLEATNGKEGCEQVLKHMPDFVLSDIMMPEMDGIEFLKQIRSNPNTSHIPFILLTAKTNLDDKFEGISSGADDYITKPFNVKLLIAKIDNIVSQRKRLTDYLTSNNTTITTKATSEEQELVAQSKLTGQDEQFIRFLREQVMNNLDNSDFTIEDLVVKTAFSRRVFFNKIKSLTGQAPIEFVREMRIRHAAELLKTGEYRVKEVTYMVGFSDIRYFTQRFKEMYGITPSQYKEEFHSR